MTGTVANSASLVIVMCSKVRAIMPSTYRLSTLAISLMGSRLPMPPISSGSNEYRSSAQIRHRHLKADSRPQTGLFKYHCQHLARQTHVPLAALIELFERNAQIEQGIQIFHRTIAYAQKMFHLPLLPRLQLVVSISSLATIGHRAHREFIFWASNFSTISFSKQAPQQCSHKCSPPECFYIVT